MWGVRLMLAIVLGSIAHGAQTNFWTNALGGAWHEPNWSLGLPNSTHSVWITNGEPKLIFINDGTAQEPSSLSVTALTISGDHELAFTSPVSLRFSVAGDLALQSGARLRNIASAVKVERWLRLQNARVFQGGGSMETVLGTYILDGARYYLTNGQFRTAVLDMPFYGIFEQYGGTAQVSSASLKDSSYRLTSGQLHVGTELCLKSGSAFFQEGGTNRAPTLAVWPDAHGFAGYVIRGGLLAAETVTIGAFLSGSMLDQIGGAMLVSNKLQVQGSARYSPPIAIVAEYMMSAGTLTAPLIELNGRGGYSRVRQSGGHISAGELAVNVPDSQFISLVLMSAGTLACDNIGSAGAGADILQTGGLLLVSNLFDFGGYYPKVGPTTGDRMPTYELKAGALVATNIRLTAEWILAGSTQAVSNPGLLRLGGILRVDDSNEQLGELVLVADSMIDLRGTRSRLAVRSGTNVWVDNSILRITNWNGSRSGGGEEQIAIGVGSFPVSAAKLAQIRFVQPAGMPPGDYAAQLLPTGEVVPVETFSGTRSGNDLVIRWFDNGKLQAATNVTGPYLDIPDARSPYTNRLTAAREQYFRVAR